MEEKTLFFPDLVHDTESSDEIKEWVSSHFTGPITMLPGTGYFFTASISLVWMD